MCYVGYYLSSSCEQYGQLSVHRLMWSCVSIDNSCSGFFIKSVHLFYFVVLPKLKMCVRTPVVLEFYGKKTYRHLRQARHVTLRLRPTNERHAFTLRWNRDAAKVIMDYYFKCGLLLMYAWWRIRTVVLKATRSCTHSALEIAHCDLGLHIRLSLDKTV